MRKALRVKKRLRPNLQAILNTERAGAKPIKRWLERESPGVGRVW
jgi:hypothetical protein